MSYGIFDPYSYLPLKDYMGRTLGITLGNCTNVKLFDLDWTAYASHGPSCQAEDCRAEAWYGVSYTSPLGTSQCYDVCQRHAVQWWDAKVDIKPIRADLSNSPYFLAIRNAVSI